MKSSFKKNSGSIIELEAELSKDEFDDYYQTAYNQAMADVDLKGFRKGHAPKELAEKAINKDKVFENAAQNAIRIGLNDIAKEHGWILIDQPRIEIISKIDGLKYKGRLTVFPEVKLGDYKKIAQKVMAESQKKEIKVSEEDIKKSLDWLRNSRAAIVAVARPAQKGDAVKVKVAFEQQNYNDQFILGEGNLMPGFEDKLVGRKAGEKLEFALDIPKDYWQKDFQGKTIDFKVDLEEVFERTLPELNDKFAQGLGKFKNLDDLKNSVKNGIIEEKKMREREKARLEILEEIEKQSQIDVPEIMINKTLESLMKESEATWKDKGKSEEETRKELKPIAEKRVKNHLIINEIAKEENIQPTEEEIRVEIQKHQHNKKAFDTDKFYDYIYGALQNKKVFEFLEKLAINKL